MINIFPKNIYTPRWIILLIDMGITTISIISAYFLRFNFVLPEDYLDVKKTTSFYWVIPFVLSVRLLSFLISKLYTGIVRYTGTKDAGRIFNVILLGSLFLTLSNLVSYFITDAFMIPHSVIGIDLLVNVFLLTASRLFVKSLYIELFTNSKKKENAVIFGISDLALITKRTLAKDSESQLKVVAFIDNTGNQTGNKLDGLGVYSSEKIENIFEKYEVTTLIIADSKFDKSVINNVINLCLDYKIRVLTLPDVNQWINGELSVNQIRKVKIEDLLERDSIKLDEEKIKKDTLNKTILVTGAAGSIGSEIVKQLLRFKPNLILIFDQAETPLYELEIELQEKHNFKNFKIIIGNVTDKYRIEKIFETHKPSTIYHAAAYKHVPMMENNPAEAVRANVLGTKTLADLAVKYKVNKFVMVSTDKAVNPTNVMGASKRIAEIYCQSLNFNLKSTKFITTRFGNVLGSNGSVINRFRKQIEKREALTVTHPDITRYFMTIPEACQLVLEAGSMGQGGEIFIFDMGKSVKIVDLAKKMIRLSGLELGKDIKINYTGLRPGEKLYEELLNNKENTLPTHHPQIMIGKTREYVFETIKEEIDLLINIIQLNNDYLIVRKMKEIVPEFLSQNSIYEELDIE
ncbi:MAG: polysaccharide biosynthesis protein [Bacteroidales bacterium]|nr:polysaccharide biosynthesis protein [Bacteroidales bacterium]MBN2758240.1 polysaccharide biosynthesis protein [Bacteroidales bacterium]